jgi:hypothetical protein
LDPGCQDAPSDERFSSRIKTSSNQPLWMDVDPPMPFPEEEEIVESP